MERNSLLSSHAYALSKILQAHQACFVHSSVETEVCGYLQGLSATGGDVSKFDIVSRCRIDAGFIRKLTKKERLKLAIQYVQKTRDWVNFSAVHNLVARHKLLYQTVIFKLWADLHLLCQPSVLGEEQQLN